MTARPLVVIGAGASWDGTRLADRHVAECLRERAEVLYVDPPLSFRSARNDPRLADAAAQPVLREQAPGIHRLTPRVPPRRRYPVVRELSAALVRRALRDAVRRLDRPVAAVLTTSSDLLGVVPGRQVHWARDDYAAAAGLMGVPAAALRRAEQRVARVADVAGAVTPALVGKWQQRGLVTALVPNGVDPERFDGELVPPLDMPRVRPLVGFCGTLSARIDLDVLHRLVDDGLDLLLLGVPQHTMPRDRLDRLVSRPGVHHLGGRPYEEVPPYIQAMDVGVVPYLDTAFNRASFPLKTLEYLAAGVPVVATDLPAVRQLGTELVTVSSPTRFVQDVRAAAHTRHDPTLVRARRSFAAEHSWQRRAEEIAAVLGI